LGATGLFFNDILLFNISGYSVTPYHLIFPLSALFVLLVDRRCVDNISGIVMVWFFMLFIEIVHVMMIGYGLEVEWFRSFAQFFVYSFSFLLVIRLRLTRGDLVALAPWTAKFGVFLSLIGIAQFILFLFGIPAYIPVDFRVRSAFDPLIDTYRYGGFSPAIGFATEPSYYSIALCVVLSSLLFFSKIGVISGRLQNISLSLILMGIMVSYSLSGIIIAFFLFLSFFASSSGKRIFALMLLGFFVWFLFNVSYADPIRGRLSLVLAGDDRSALMRVVASSRLLFSGTSRLETSLLGTGMGLEYREFETYLRVYLQVLSSDRAISEIKVHNIFTTIKLLQGWVGLALYMVMVWLTLRPAIQIWRLCVPLLFFFLIYHFSIGLYLTPAFWSVYALISILGKSDLSAEHGVLPGD